MSCANLTTAAGTKLYYSATLPTTYDEAGYAALTWTELADISSIGEFGKVYATATFKPLATRTTCKRKGSYDFGSIQMGLGYSSDAAGTTAMLAALASDLGYAFKIVLNDATATLVLPTKFYFAGQVMSFKINPGSDPDAFVTATLEIQIDGDVLTDVRSAT